MLALALDVKNREEFRAALDAMSRAQNGRAIWTRRCLNRREDSPPTIGVLGTVVGLIDALRHFSDLATVGSAVGTASTLYGSPVAAAAHRIRSASEDEAQADELIAEGGLGIYDSIHPTMLRERLSSFLRHPLPDRAKR